MLVSSVFPRQRDHLVGRRSRQLRELKRPFVPPRVDRDRFVRVGDIPDDQGAIIRDADVST